MTQPEDRELLSQLAAQVTEGVILEIGSKNGKSARAMAETANVPIYCIDMWDLTFMGDKRPPQHLNTDKAFKQAVEGFGVTPIKGISSEIAKVWDKPIGLLFIDGKHSYEGCLADYEGFARHVIPNGILAFHDYGLSQYGVTQVADEIREEWDDWKQARTIAYMRRSCE